jgi:hypothetical protein
VPRDTHGRPVKSEAAEPIRYGPAKDKENDPDKRKAKKAFDQPAEHLQEHHDRLCRIEEHLGLSEKADAYKDEDQGGKGKIGAGHVTEKGGATYTRKRH